MTSTYHVCYSSIENPEIIHFIEVPDGAELATGQPLSDNFTNPDDAAVFAFQLGYGFKQFSLHEEFETSEYVSFDGMLFRALNNIAPYQPSIDPDVQELPPIPTRAIANWVLVYAPDEFDEAV